MELFFDIETVYICYMELMEIELFLTFKLSNKKSYTFTKQTYLK